MEGWHHTCPSGSQSEIRCVKIIGWCANNDGTRAGEGYVIENNFYFATDYHDYSANKHTTQNNIFWPRANGAVGMVGWNILGSGGGQSKK